MNALQKLPFETCPAKPGRRKKCSLLFWYERAGIKADPGLIFGRSCGLSLIELLVVIAVIGILVGILIPVTARARDSAKVAACQSNLREPGKAVYLFATGHEDHTPSNIDFEVDPARLNDLSGAFAGGLRDFQVLENKKDWRSRIC